MKVLFQRFLQSAVFWNYLTVALRSGAAILILPLVLRTLPPEELGLWYVFLGLAGLAALVDLGFGASLTRSVAYLWAGAAQLLPIGIQREGGAQNGNGAAGPNYHLLGSLIATMRRFYLLVGGLLLLVLELGGGAWIWEQTGGLANRDSLRAAWAVFALGCALNAVAGFWSGLLTGINGVKQAQKVFLISLILNYAFTIGGLLAGWGVWAMVGGQVLMGLSNRLLGRASFLGLAGPRLDYRNPPADWGLLRILWPNSWRNAAISGGLYLLFHTGTLLASIFLDLTATASYGLSLQVVLFLSQLTAVLVHIKMPLISQLRGRHELEAIRQIFIPRMLLCMGGYLAGALVLLFLGDWLLGALVGARTPLLPRFELGVLLLVIGLEVHTSLFRELVLTANQNPFVKPVLFSALTSVVLAMILTPATGLLGVMLAPGLVQLLFNNWWIVGQGIRSLELEVKDYLSRCGQFLFQWPGRQG